MEQMETIDVRTASERARDEKHRAVCEAFVGLSAERPELRPNRVMSVVAGRYGLTVPGVRGILIRHGLYAPGEGRTGGAR